MSVGDGGYGFVIENNSELVNNTSVDLGNNSIFVYAAENNSIINNGIITSSSENNIALYSVNGGCTENNASLIMDTGRGNIGIFKDGNSSEEWVDTIQLGVHNKYKADGWQLRNDITGRASIHNIDRNIDWPNPGKRSEMDGTYETYSITSDNILGKEFELGKRVSVMPYGAFKAMYVTRPTFSENGLESLEVDGNDAWSAKPRAGIEVEGTMPLGKNSEWQLKGALDIAYEYELADLNETEKARLTAIEDKYHKLAKPEEEKGTFRTKAVIGIEAKDRYGIFLTGEYGVGNSDQDDYRAGLTMKAVF